MKSNLCDPSASSESLWLLRATGRSTCTRIQMAYPVMNHAQAAGKRAMEQVQPRP